MTGREFELLIFIFLILKYINYFMPVLQGIRCKLNFYIFIKHPWVVRAMYLVH